MPRLELLTGFGWYGKALLVLVVACAAAVLMRRASAGARHAVWACALLGVLALPLLAVVAPSVYLPQLGALAGAWHTPDTAPAASVTIEVTAVGEGPGPGATGWVASAQAHSPECAGPSLESAYASRPNVAGTLPPGPWIAVAAAAPPVLFLLLLCAGMLRLWRLHRASLPFPAPLDRELRDLAERLAIRVAVRGRLSPTRSIPMTWGLFRAVILLPAEAEDWPADRLRMVLMHELAHVRRRDCLVQSLGQLACAVHWFNPLSWLALARLRAEQERACDDVVLAHGFRPDEYAAALLTVTAGARRLRLAGALALAIGHTNRMERRISDVLDERRNHRPLTPRRAAWIAAAAVVLLSLIAGLSRPQPTQASAEREPPPYQRFRPDPGLRRYTLEPEGERGAQSAAVAQAESGGALSADAVRDLILESASIETNRQALTEAAIRGMLESLDAPNSQLLVGDSYRLLQELSSEPRLGIGAQLMQQDAAVVVVCPLPRSPAHAAGIKPGDVVLEIDGVAAGDLLSVVSAIRGPAGTVVRIKVRRAGGEDVELSITRGPFEVASVTGLNLDMEGEWHYWLNSEERLAFVRIVQFGPKTHAELTAALRGLGTMRGLVLDVRRCPGGLLAECLSAARLFIPDGELLSIQSRGKAVETFSASGGAAWSDVPLVVLIDETTASAGEVLAGALRDHGRAVVVGDRTMGKGTVEQLIPLSSPQTALKLTTGAMRLPSGRLMQRTRGSAEWGVDPTDGFYVPLSAEQRSFWRDRRATLESIGGAAPVLPVTAESAVSDLRDPQLAAAIAALHARLAGGEFAPTGRPLAELTAQVARREQLRAEKEKLERDLQRVQQELGE
jgi:carboxyl-terminal processing protease